MLIKVLLVFSFFVSVISAKPESFSISGQIKNNSEYVTILFKRYHITQNVQTVLDTIPYNNNGSFAKSFSHKPGIYQLDFKGTGKIVLAIEAGQRINISFDAKGKGLKDLKISGSHDSELIMQYDAFRKKTYDLLVRPIRNKIKDARKDKNNALVNKLTNDETRELTNYRDKLAQFAVDNFGHSIALFYSTVRMDGDQNIKTLQEISSWFLQNRPGLELTKNLAAKVNRFTKLAIGQPAPSFTLLTADGKQFQPADFKGRYLLIDFWASWCLPCRLENPNYVEQYKHYKTKGFEILSVSLDTNEKLWQQASKRDKITWPNVSDLQAWASETAKIYNISSIPANFLLDKNGLIIAKNIRGADLEKRLKALFD